MFVEFDSPKDPRKTPGVDEAFESEIELFEKIGGDYVTNININFGDVGDPPTIGRCTTYTNSTLKAKRVYKEIYIKKSFWDNASTNQRETLMLHELGHCVLNKNHNNSVMDYEGRSVPSSIMNSYNIGAGLYYYNNKQHYYDELIGR